MSIQHFLSVYWWVIAGIVISVAYTAWPMTAKMTGMPPAWITPVVLVATLIGTMVPGTKGMMGQPFTWNPLGFIIFVVAGLANGVGAYYYGVITVDKEVPTSLFVAVVMVGTILCSQAMGILITGEVRTLQQSIGIALVCIGIGMTFGPKLF